MLEPIVDGWNVVLTGQWHPTIFTPDWIRQFLASDKDITVDMPNVPTLPPRIRFDGIHLLAMNERLVFGTRKVSAKALVKMQDSAVKVCGQFPHNLISAVGVNFAYTTKDNEKLAKVVQLSDAQSLTKAGLKTVSTTVRRTMFLDEQLINLTVDSQGKGETVFTINFHYDVKNCQEAISHLDQKVPELKKKMDDLLQATYQLNPK